MTVVLISLPNISTLVLNFLSLQVRFLPPLSISLLPYLPNLCSFVNQPLFKGENVISTSGISNTKRNKLFFTDYES